MDKEAMMSVAEVIRTKDKFLLSAHVNPEGDSVGSQIAMFLLLRKIGKKAAIVNHDEVPHNLRFLEGSREITKHFPEELQPSVAIMLDCPVMERTGRVGKLLEEECFIVNIDHHISNEYFGDVNWVEPGVSSVGEMVFNLAQELKIEIDKPIAEAIYAAIVTDTGMFNYGNTSSDTHRVVGELMSAGVSPKYMFSQIFEKRSDVEMRILGKALSDLQVAAGGKLAYMSISKEMYESEGVKSVPTDDFINFPRSIEGVEVAILFKENPAARGRVNVSFRSSGKADVNKLAALFGGGGHPQASGCVIECPLADARQRVLDEASKMIQEM